jgi:hypothetical protein
LSKDVFESAYALDTGDFVHVGAPLRAVPSDEAIARSGFPGASAKEQTANRTTIAVNGQIADAAAHFGGKAQVVVLR